MRNSKLSKAVHALGESIEIFYEPRNKGEEWYVGLADSHGSALPLHGHFKTLIEGVKWLQQNKKYLDARREGS